MREKPARPSSRPLDAAALRVAAERYLARFPASSAQLERVLWRRVDRYLKDAGGAREAFAPGVKGAVEHMQAIGLLDDAAYARALARSEHRRGRPLARVRMKLREKGIEGALADAALALLASESEHRPDEEAALAYARRRRLGPFSTSAERRKERREKDLAAMCRAGFSFGIARKVIDGGFSDDD